MNAMEQQAPPNNAFASAQQPTQPHKIESTFLFNVHFEKENVDTTHSLSDRECSAQTTWGEILNLTHQRYGEKFIIPKVTFRFVRATGFVHYVSFTKTDIDSWEPTTNFQDILLEILDKEVWTKTKNLIITLTVQQSTLPIDAQVPTLSNKQRRDLAIEKQMLQKKLEHLLKKALNDYASGRNQFVSFLLRNFLLEQKRFIEALNHDFQ
ncbi:MAG: hypothetical protein UU47_C0030G0004 [candidate division TM6 bacterium GW2011_GWE2_41_16]|nr:MAG: hypothetical protein UU47_C0030G0004 [candidate division TM6 bacterium GW2011_GWE2_41_16]